MKKILSLLVLIIAFSSCEEDVKFNNPAVQGKKDDVFWKASSSTATVVGTSLTIYAYTPFEVLTLTTSSIAPGTYTLGVNNSNTASYSFEADGISSSYATGAGIGDGEIVIEADQFSGTITGSFRFNAPATSGIGDESVNFSEGVFYRVPIQAAQ